ncbi:lipoate--protein ligase family protein [Halorubrum sp. 48-1-W]|uniref:lipoate--protein ligase family protein n=1 Tax=Halorubrum sp. 48-1-W TaxID=2249761 RepID=UPI000DCBFE58|nr:lipoate--protein ligase family protein [Halorubrum sp. 48-1-W]RAW44006.1 lipoate--protein ligase family protein [Halorubrum sp. 48-1-W]
MRVLRGRDASPRVDSEHTARLLAEAADGRPGVRVWAPPKQLAFGRRDVREPGYDRARRVAETRGFVPIRRDVGGRAVAHTGDSLAFALAVPRDGDGGSIDARYATIARAIRSALEGCGAGISPGEPPSSFCPGDHSLRVAASGRSEGGKLAGIAQRVRADAALVAGCLVVSRHDADEIATVVESVYDALDVPFDPGSVGSVEAAGGPNDTRRVARAVEQALVERAPGGSRRVERVGPEPW